MKLEEKQDNLSFEELKEWEREQKLLLQEILKRRKTNFYKKRRWVWSILGTLIFTFYYFLLIYINNDGIVGGMVADSIFIMIMIVVVMVMLTITAMTLFIEANKQSLLTSIKTKLPSLTFITYSLSEETQGDLLELKHSLEEAGYSKKYIRKHIFIQKTVILFHHYKQKAWDKITGQSETEVD